MAEDQEIMTQQVICVMKRKGDHNCIVGFRSLPRDPSDPEIDPEKSGGGTVWTVPKWNTYVAQGYTFFTYGDGKVAWVGTEKCDCGKDTFIRTHPDGTKINNLDDLRQCRPRA